MQHHLARFELMQRALRTSICTQCWQRPPGSEALPPTQPRACEPACTIFLNLPTLAAIAAQERDDELAPYDQAMRDLICAHCKASPTAGDFCVDGQTRTCPLSRYAKQVIDVLDRCSRAHVPA